MHHLRDTVIRSGNLETLCQYSAAMMPWASAGSKTPVAVEKSPFTQNQSQMIVNAVAAVTPSSFSRDAAEKTVIWKS